MSETENTRTHGGRLCAPGAHGVPWFAERLEEAAEQEPRAEEHREVARRRN